MRWLVVVAFALAMSGCQDQYVVCDAISGGNDDFGVYGKVTAAGSGASLNEARVQFNSSEGLVDHALTNRDGCYLRELPVTNSEGPAHRWEVEVTMDGYETYRGDLGIHPAGDSVRRDVSLQPL